MKSGDSLESQWYEIRELWTDIVAEKFVRQHLVPILEYSSKLDEVLEQLESITSKRPY